MKKLFLSFALGVFFASPLWGEDTSPVRVIEAQGESAAYAAAMSSEWQAVYKDLAISKNQHLRTGSQSFVVVAMDDAYRGLVRLEENTDLIIQNESPLKVLLIRGKLFISLGEDLAEAAPGVRISTANSVIESPAAGFSVEVKEGVTQVCVFEESLKLTLPPIFFGMAPKSVMLGEGYRWVSGSGLYAAKSDRMLYQDYLPWQSWIRRLYELRDDLAAEALERSEQ